jgi:hypothetical protein
MASFEMDFPQMSPPRLNARFNTIVCNCSVEVTEEISKFSFARLPSANA